MAAFQDYAGSGGSNTPGGHYRMAFQTGLTTIIAGGGAIFCFRWTQPALFCRLLKLKVSGTVNTAMGTAQTLDVAAFRATGWSAGPTAGVTLTNFKNGENAMADAGVITGMANLLQICPAAATNIAVANTGAVTKGTLTVDGNPFAYDVFNMTALGSSDRVTLYDVAWGNEYPLTFGNNEGLVLTVPTTQGATGVIVYYITMTIAVNNLPF